MKIISMVNKKGGTGKTSSVASLAYLVSTLEKKVLLLDLDPQRNLTSLYQTTQTEHTINDIFCMFNYDMNYQSIKETISKTNYENIDIIAGYEDLDETIDLVSIDQRRIPQLIVKNALSYVSQDYDFVFIDNTPYFNLLTRNGLCSATDVVIPVDCNGFSYEGLNKLLSKVQEIKRELNPELNIAGIFLTKVNKNTNIYKELKKEYQHELGNKFMESSIRQDNSINESNTVYIPLPHYKNSNAIKDYRKLLYELNVLDQQTQEKLRKDIEKDEQIEVKKKRSGK